MDPSQFFGVLFQSSPPPPNADLAQATALWILIGLLASRLVAGPAVYFAARKRDTGSEVWWGTLAALLPLIGVIAFLLVRPRPPGPVVAAWNPWITCPYCGTPRGYSPQPCPRCGQMLAPAFFGPPALQYAPLPPPSPQVPNAAPGTPLQALAPYGPWPAVMPPGRPAAPYGVPGFLFPPPASRPPAKANDITGVQVLGAALFTFVLAGVAMYALILPALMSGTVSQTDILNLGSEPWFVLFELLVQDSILIAIAYDQGVFRKRLTREEMGLRVDRAAGPLPKQVGLGIFAGAGTFLVSVVALQLLIDALTMSGVDVSGAGPALQPRIASLADYGFWVASGVVVAPIAEELFFRGYALSGFMKRGLTNRGLVVTSLLFAAIHLDPFSFGPLFIAGMVLGMLRVRTNSLAAPIAAHATNNLIVMTLTLFGL